MQSEQHKTVKITLPLDLLCAIWDSKTDPNQDLDSRLEELLIKGLKAQGKIASTL